MAALPSDAVLGYVVAVHAVGLREHPVVPHGLPGVVVHDENFAAQFREVGRVVGRVALQPCTLAGID
jgi:hypothetical protein